jgi:hypothetical protein
MLEAMVAIATVTMLLYTGVVLYLMVRTLILCTNREDSNKLRAALKTIFHMSLNLQSLFQYLTYLCLNFRFDLALLRAVREGASISHSITFFFIFSPQFFFHLTLTF